MEYELTIRQLNPYTEEETKESNRNNNRNIYPLETRYSDKLFHEIRILQTKVSEQEFQAVKKALISII